MVVAQGAPGLETDTSLEASPPPGDPGADTPSKSKTRGGDGSPKLGSKDGPPPITEPGGGKSSVGGSKPDVNSQVVVVVVVDGHGADWVDHGDMGWDTPAVDVGGTVVVDGVGSSHQGEEGNGNN